MRGANASRREGDPTPSAARGKSTPHTGTKLIQEERHVLRSWELRRGRNMKPLGRQVTAATRQVGESWITWVVFGAAAGTGVLLSQGLGASETDQPRAPTGIEIEAAVAQAEAQGNAARQARAAE